MLQMQRYATDRRATGEAHEVLFAENKNTVGPHQQRVRTQSVRSSDETSMRAIDTEKFDQTTSPGDDAGGLTRRT